MSTEIKIAFFDMDHTTIDNDCDVSWKEFLVDEGLAPASEMREARRYWDLYCRDELPEGEFIEFQLRQFRGKSPEEMARLALRHYEGCVKNKVFPEAARELENFKNQNVARVMLTATNRVVAEPVCRGLGMEDILATELETRGGLYTGRVAGEYCIREGKTRRAEAYCLARNTDLNHAVYYGDSLSDVPMLEKSGSAVAVNPRGALLELALKNGWRVARWSS